MLNERYVKISNDLQLKIRIFPGYLNRVVYFLPGWIADLNNLMPFIGRLQEAGFTVKYVETREKKSSIFSNKLSRDDFNIEKYVNDLEKIIEHEDDYHFQFLSASIGAHVVMRYLKNKKGRRPQSTILLIPALEIKFNKVQRLLIRIPRFLRPIMIKMIEFYMKKKFLNPKEPEMAYKYSIKMYEIDVQKFLMSARAIDSVQGIKLTQYPRLIDDKVLVVGAENDLLHPEPAMKEFAQEFENGEYVGLYSNQYTHGELFGRLAAKYYNGEEYEYLLEEIERGH